MTLCKCLYLGDSILQPVSDRLLLIGALFRFSMLIMLAVINASCRFNVEYFEHILVSINCDGEIPGQIWPPDISTSLFFSFGQNNTAGVISLESGEILLPGGSGLMLSLRKGDGFGVTVAYSFGASEVTTQIDRLKKLPSVLLNAWGEGEAGVTASISVSEITDNPESYAQRVTRTTVVITLHGTEIDKVDKELPDSFTFPFLLNPLIETGETIFSFDQAKLKWKHAGTHMKVKFVSGEVAGEFTCLLPDD